MQIYSFLRSKSVVLSRESARSNTEATDGKQKVVHLHFLRFD